MSEVKYNIRPVQEEILKIFKVFVTSGEKNWLRQFCIC